MFLREVLTGWTAYENGWGTWREGLRSPAGSFDIYLQTRNLCELRLTPGDGQNSK